MGHSPSLAPLSRGLGPDPLLRTLLQTTIRTAKPPDSQVELFPVPSPLLWKSLRWRLWVRRDARADDADRSMTPCELRVQPPLVMTSITAGSHLCRPHAMGTGGQCPPPTRCGVGDAMRDAQADLHWPNSLGRNIAFKTRWFMGFYNSHQVSHFTMFFIYAIAEISVAESSFDIRETSPPPVHPADGGHMRRTLRSVFLSAYRRGFVSPHGARVSAHRSGEEAGWGHSPYARAPVLLITYSRSIFACFDDDPVGGSPTKTLLQLILPQNDKVQLTSRDSRAANRPRRL
ncbi:UNVERIFIED_CONTAM: hypothetical protein Sindi_2893400 [Sesamum indicum]